MEYIQKTNERNLSKLSKLIDKYLIPQELEKKKNAEVSTPHALRQEMLDKIPVEFWTTPKKVFEPCSGKGGFVIDIVDRFMVGLSNLITDEKERYRVIVEECLYFSDINPTNIYICSLLLDPRGEYKLNFNEGNTLELDIKVKWNITGFDAVIGNPPYQTPSGFNKNSKVLWCEFVTTAVEFWLVNSGYLLYVHPSIWRKPGNILRAILFTKQMHYLSIHNKIEGLKVFGATTRFDYYLLENIPTYKSTKIVFEDKKTHHINISDNLPHIPNFGWSIFEKVFSKINNNTICTKSSSKLGTSHKKVSTVKNNVYKFTLFNSSSRTKGITYRYSSIEHDIQKYKKVLFSNGEVIVPIYDDGKLGITQGGIYVEVKNEFEGKRLLSFLNTKLIIYLIKASKWSNFETSKQLFWYIPYPADIINLNDDTVNNYFELTKDEVIQIT